jgi:hypothetical protein
MSKKRVVVRNEKKGKEGVPGKLFTEREKERD